MPETTASIGQTDRNHRGAGDNPTVCSSGAPTGQAATDSGAVAAGRATRHELRDLYDEYAACLDDRDLESWPGFFTEDALYRVISRENHDAGLTHAAMYCDGRPMIRDRVVAIRQTTVYEPRFLRHFISGVRIRAIHDDTIEATANFAVFEALANSEPRLGLFGRYLDTLVRVDGDWRFKERSCVYDNSRIHTSLIFPV